MIKTPMELRALTSDLSNAVWSFATIGVLLESGLVEHMKEPRTIDELAAACPALPRGRIAKSLELGAALGFVVRDGERWQLAEGAKGLAHPAARTALMGEIRTHLMQPLAFLDEARSGGKIGWSHTSPVILQAQGDASSMFPTMFKNNIMGQLGDLATRIEAPGARMLDVGVGVGGLAIGFCQMFPHVSMVGLDAWEVPLAIARENVAKAGLQDRIELRQCAVETLTDESAFDLAWFPTFFIRPDLLSRAVSRVHAALRAGGWIIFGMFGDSTDARTRAVWGLATELWGGPTLSSADADSILRAAGFTTVRQLPSPPGAPTAFVAQR
jgi:hypothetical protein